MGNCQTNLSEEELEFKRKQIFKPKPNINSNNSNKQNVPPPQLDTFSIATPNQQPDRDKDLQFHKQHNKESAVTYHLSNSLVEVKISAVNQNQPITKPNLPTLISKDTNHSSNDKDSDRNDREMISVDSILNNFRQNDLLNSNPRKSIQVSGPNKQSQSYIQKQQLRMKYTKSYYVDDDQNQIQRA